MDLLNVSSLTHRLRDGGLFDISFGVEPGERFAILGPAAAGKSTLLTALAGLLQPEVGSVQIRGCKPREATSSIGFGLQSDTLKRSSTPRQLILSSLASKHVPAPQRGSRLAEALHMSDLAEQADRPIAEINYTAIVSLRVAIAVAHRPEVILLDDLIRLLSKEQAERWWAYLEDRMHLDGAIVIHVTMDSPEAEAADRVLLLAGGRVLACDKPSSLIENCTMEEIVVEAADADCIDTTLRGIPQVEAVSTPSGVRFLAPSGSDIAAHLFRHPLDHLRGVFVRRPDLWDCVRSLSVPEGY